jgi:hypothetical protein
VGLSRPATRLLARTLASRRRFGAALTFGKSGVEGSYDQVRTILLEEGIAAAALADADVHYDDLTQYGSSLHQDTLFRMLGFAAVHSVDYCATEQPTYQLDLNSPLPEALRGRYGLVVDAGTSEHCFDVRQVWSNAVAALVEGGLVCHLSPMTGWVGHGFYSFSPTALLDFYSANGFEDLELKILYSRGVFGRTYYRDYTPQQAQLYANFPGRSLLFFLARKARQLSEPVVPIQGVYAAGGTQHGDTGMAGLARFAVPAMRLLGPEGASEVYLKLLGAMRALRFAPRKRLRR